MRRDHNNIFVSPSLALYQKRVSSALKLGLLDLIPVVDHFCLL